MKANFENKIFMFPLQVQEKANQLSRSKGRFSFIQKLFRGYFK